MGAQLDLWVLGHPQRDVIPTPEEIYMIIWIWRLAIKTLDEKLIIDVTGRVKVWSNTRKSSLMMILLGGMTLLHTYSWLPVVCNTWR